MSTIPIRQTPGSPPAESLEERFRRLEGTWHAETAYLSSAAKIVQHPAFQEIIHMGRSVVPFMLRDLERKPGLWVWALPEIMGADPVPASDRGNIAKMTEAWLRWARANGCTW